MGRLLSAMLKWLARKAKNLPELTREPLERKHEGQQGRSHHRRRGEKGHPGDGQAQALKHDTRELRGSDGRPRRFHHETSYLPDPHARWWRAPRSAPQKIMRIMDVYIYSHKPTSVK